MSCPTRSDRGNYNIIMSCKCMRQANLGAEVKELECAVPQDVEVMHSGRHHGAHSMVGKCSRGLQYLHTHTHTPQHSAHFQQGFHSLHEYETAFVIIY